MRIGLDYDDVLSPFLICTIREINHRYNKSYTVEDIKGWNMLDYIDITQEELFSIWTPEFINSIPLKRGAKELIDKLKSMGHEVYIVTACWSEIYKEREKKCIEELGMSVENVLFIKHKYLLNLDVLIDDKLDNHLDEYGLPCKFERVVYDMPHNRIGTNKLGFHYRAENFQDVIDIVKLIDKNNKK